ncbi:hypothetical protein KDA14_05945, partial [Candidatus Saccharibacteria bacterium]|nr:hypothetical protein [Candidatus Saccharibacteria bacterium]
AVLEGQFGTKAEAGTHASIAFFYTENRHGRVLSTLNHHCVNPLVSLNWGPQYKDTVRLISQPLGDDQREFLQAIYEKVLGSSDGMLAEIDNLNLQSIRDLLGVPTNPDAEDDSTSFAGDLEALLTATKTTTDSTKQIGLPLTTETDSNA